MAQIRQKICITCGAELRQEQDNMYVCPACGNHYEMSECAGLIDDLRDAQVSRLSLDFGKAEIYCEKLLDKYTNANDDDALSAIYWELLLCEQRVIFEQSGVNGSDDMGANTFPSFYDIVSTDIDDSKYCAAVIEYATKSNSSRLATYESLIEKMVMSKRTYKKIKKTTEPFDIFICFKKTADDGATTKDCQIATEIYNRLDDDYNVFFSERTLQQLSVGDYEPNIYHALYTAPVMILLCSKKDYLTSRWVRNEWNRFVDMSKKTSQLKRIIPVFVDDFSPEDLPDELRKYQGIKDGRALLSDVSNAVKKVIKPTDKSAELAARLEKLEQAKMSTMLNISSADYDDSAVIKQYADSLFDEKKYDMARHAYADYLRKKPDDYKVAYMYAKCDSESESLDSSNIIKLAKATEKFIDKLIIDESVWYKEVDVDAAINNLANRRNKFMEFQYNAVLSSPIFSEKKKVFMNGATSALAKFKDEAKEYAGAYHKDVNTQLNDALTMLEYLMNKRNNFNNIEKLVDRQISSIKSCVEHLKKKFTLCTSEEAYSIQDHIIWSDKNYEYSWLDAELVDDWESKIDTKIQSCQQYLKAVKLLNEAKYFDALNILRTFDLYDSKTLLAKCIEDGRDEILARAKGFYEENDFYNAVDYFTILQESCLECAEYIEEIRARLVEDKYVRAKILFEEKKYFNAYKFLNTLAVSGEHSIELSPKKMDGDATSSDHVDKRQINYTISEEGYKDTKAMKEECERIFKKLKKIALISGGAILLIIIIIIIACSV